MSSLILPRRIREGRQFARPRDQRGFIINPYVFGSGPPPITVDQYAATLFVGDASYPRSIAGVDLSGGGIAWLKSRNSSERHYFIYSPNGSSPQLINPALNTAAAAAAATFDAAGVNLTSSAAGNTNLLNYVCWSMKKVAGFLDIVTYTGNGANRTIAHSLGVTPGMILIKQTGATGDWIMWHKGIGAGSYQYFSSALGNQVSATHWNSTNPTSSVFSLGTSTEVNQNTRTYVAFVFADDPTGVIQPFTYTGNGSSPGATVSLGWHPQYLLWAPNASQNKLIMDSTRTAGFAGNDETLFSNQAVTSDSATDNLQLVGTGFTPNNAGSAVNVNVNARTYYGLAIRAP